MNIRKFLNFTDEEQDNIIGKQYIEIVDYFNKIQKDINDKNEQKVIDRNTICSKCDSKNVVDKIIVESRRQSRTKIVRIFFLSF